MNTLPSHIIREISYILHADASHRSLAALTCTNKQIRSSAVEVLFEELDWEEDDEDEEEDEGAGQFMRVFKRKKEQGDEMPDVLKYVKHLTLTLRSPTYPSRLYSFLVLRCPRLQYLKLTIHLSLLSSTYPALIPQSTIHPFLELKELDLSFPNWHDCGISASSPNRDDLTRIIGGDLSMNMKDEMRYEDSCDRSVQGMTSYRSLQSIILDLDLSPFSTFDLGIPPHWSSDNAASPQQHTDGRSVTQTPKIKILCFDDELYHVPWVAKCLWRDVKVLDVGYTPRRGMPFVSGSFTEYCQSLTSLHTLRLSTTLVHPTRLPRNTTAYALKGSELKDIFRDLHEHMRSFGRLEYQVGLEGDLGRESAHGSAESMRHRCNSWIRRKGRKYTRQMNALMETTHPTQECCNNLRRLIVAETSRVFATAVIRCKGGQDGLEVKTTKWKEYKDKVTDFDQILDHAADDMALHGGTWFPEEEPGVGPMPGGGGGGGGEGGGGLGVVPGIPMMWHGPHGMQMMAVPGGLAAGMGMDVAGEFQGGMQDGSVSSFGDDDAESEEGWTTEEGDVEMGEAGEAEVEGGDGPAHKQRGADESDDEEEMEV